MGKKEPSTGGEVRRTLILMQETAPIQSPQTPHGHYPQEQAGSGGDMVTPRASARRKFWQVGGESTEEVESLVQQHAEAPDHEPSESDPDVYESAPNGSRATLLCKAVSNCLRGAHRAYRFSLENCLKSYRETVLLPANAVSMVHCDETLLEQQVG